MNRLIHRSASAVGALLLLTSAACGGGGDGSGSAQPAEEPSSQSPTQAATMQETAESGGGGDDVRAATTIETAQSRFGRILVDADGMTLYMFDPDKQGRSVCDAACLQAWPPVEGPADAGQGVDDSMLGTVKATDGTTMATYNDWPLYYWVQDKQPGDVTGQAEGDVWWVMSTDGKPIRQMP